MCNETDGNLAKPTNTLAYYKNLQIVGKRFLTLSPGCDNGSLSPTRWQ